MPRVRSHVRSPSPHPKCHSGLRPLTHSGEIKRWRHHRPSGRQSTMKQRPPLQVVAAAILILSATTAVCAVWAVFISAIGGGIQSVPEFLAYPWFSVPLALEVFLGIAIAVLVVRGWRLARLAVLVAILLWAPDLLPSDARAGSEPNYPLQLWLAWFAVAMHLSALTLLFSKAATPWFKQHRAHTISSDT